MPDIALLYSPQNRARALTAAAALVVIVASVDWVVKPNFSLNFLYLFPIMLAGGFLSRWQIAALGVCCAVLGELFSPFPQADAATRMAMMSVAFIGTGLFVSELVHKRQLVVEHLQALSNVVADFAAKIRSASDATAAWGDATTADVFTQISREVDKDLWLLEAHLDAREIGQRVVDDSVSSGAREASLA